MILALDLFFNAAKSPRHFLGRSQELMRHSDPILTTKIYTDAGMLPIWDAVGARPMFNDTQIDTQKLDRNGQTAPPTVPFESSIRNFLGAEDKTLSPLEAGSVQKSPESEIGSRGRIRTYDQSVNSRPLYH
jgi:hypothetical protein